MKTRGQFQTPAHDSALNHHMSYGQPHLNQHPLNPHAESLPCGTPHRLKLQHPHPVVCLGGFARHQIIPGHGNHHPRHR